MCPVCKEPMATFEFEGSFIDGCVECGGTWLDTGEIEMLGTFETGDLDRMSADLARAAEVRRTSRPCPRCSRKLGEIHMGSDPHLVLDRCPWGHGVWFDRGEMYTLVGSFDGELLGPAARFFSDLYRNAVARTEEGGR